MRGDASFDSRDRFEKSNAYSCEDAARVTAVRRLSMLQRSLPELKRACTILDVGAGMGHISRMLGERGHSVFAIDRSTFAARTVSLQPGFQFVMADAEFPLPFRDGRFDLALLFDAIEHLQDPRAVLVELKRVLRRGGSVVITTPNASTPVRWLLHEKWVGESDPSHLALFTPYTLEFLLRRVGIQVVRIGTDSPGHPLLSHLLGRLGLATTLTVIARTK